MPKKNVVLIGDIVHTNLYSQVFKAFSSNNKINLEPHNIPPHNLGTPGFEHHCIVEDVHVIVFCGKEYSVETKESFAADNATKPILVVLPDEAETLYLQEDSNFPATIIALHDKHIGKRRTPRS